MDSPDFKVSKPTYTALSAEGAALGLCVGGAGCFKGVRTYIQRLLASGRFQNLPPEDSPKRPDCPFTLCTEHIFYIIGGRNPKELRI